MRIANHSFVMGRGETVRVILGSTVPVPMILPVYIYNAMSYAIRITPPLK